MPMQPLTKVKINGILSKAESVAHTTDLWQSGGQQLYMTVTSHIIDEDKKLKYFFTDLSHKGFSYNWELTTWNE